MKKLVWESRYTVVVLEHWSGENTFFIFNNGAYTTKSGGGMFQYSDFNFSGIWPNHKDMTDTIHESGMKLILWQIPVMTMPLILIPVISLTRVRGP